MIELRKFLLGWEKGTRLVLDDSGNRIDVDNDFGSTTYTTGANNRLDSDGVYDYQYDGEGNLIKQTEITSGDYRVFEWDHRNRLASVSDYDDTHALQQKFSYIYDAFDRLVGKRSDTDGNGTINGTEAYIYDGNQIVLRFADDDAASLAAADLTNRYLWGPNVDQLLAEENVASLGAAGTVDWPLTDHLGTIRDWARYSSGSTTILDHAEIDAFGNRLDAPSVDSIFAYTARYRDADTGLQYNWERWYDPGTGRWNSEDPIRFAGDPSNIYRYVGNSPSNFVDPTGLAKIAAKCGRLGFGGLPVHTVTVIVDCSGLAEKCAKEACNSHGEGLISWDPVGAAPSIDRGPSPEQMTCTYLAPWNNPDGCGHEGWIKGGCLVTGIVAGGAAIGIGVVGGGAVAGGGAAAGGGAVAGGQAATYAGLIAMYEKMIPLARAMGECEMAAKMAAELARIEGLLTKLK